MGNSSLITSKKLDKLILSGPILPRLYDISKVHKAGLPFHPTVGIVGSQYHMITKWLTHE